MAIEPIIESQIYKVTTPFDKTGTVFLYVIRSEDCVALIDTGAVDSPATVLVPALESLHLQLKDVDLLLITHAHLDHAGGHKEIKDASGAKIYLHEADLFMARSVEAQVEYHVGPQRALGFPEEALKAREQHVRHNAGSPFEPDELLQDGMTIDVGKVRLRVVHCPGHTPGLCCFYFEKEGILFTADGIQGQGARPGSFPYYFNAPDYKRSVLKIQDINPGTLCLGHAFHGGSLVNNPVRTGGDVAAFLKSSLVTSNAIHEAVRQAGKGDAGSDAEIARKALDDLLYEVPQLRSRLTGMPLLAAPTLLSHIEALRAGTFPEG